MRTRSSSSTADGSVDDHVPLNRIVVINPNAHQPGVFRSEEKPPLDDDAEAENVFSESGTAPKEDVVVAAKFIESLRGPASGWLAKLDSKTLAECMRTNTCDVVSQ